MASDPLEIASRGMFSRNLVVDAAGVQLGKKRLAWTEVDHYRYDLQDWRRRGDFELTTAANRVVRLEPIFDHWPLLAEYVLDALHPRLRADPYFHPFDLAADGLGHVGLGRVAYADLDHVELAAVGTGVVVFVHTRAKKEWVRAELRDIANLWLWLEALIARGVSVRSELDFHLPPSLSPLAAHLALAGRLPAAKLVR